MKIEENAWPNAPQVRKLQEEQIAIDVLELRKAVMLNLEIPSQGRICAWSCRLGVASGLIWYDLLNTAPPTLALMGVGLIGFPAKKITGEFEGRPWGLVNCLIRRKIAIC